MLNRIKCFFGWHDYVPKTVDFGEVGPVLSMILMRKPQFVRAEIVKNHYLEYWLICDRCRHERPRFTQKDMWDVTSPENKN